MPTYWSVPAADAETAGVSRRAQEATATAAAVRGSRRERELDT
jgi:hypothetical protein